MKRLLCCTALSLLAAAPAAAQTPPAAPAEAAPTAEDWRRVVDELKALRAEVEANMVEDDLTHGAFDAVVLQDAEEPRFRIYGFIDMGFRKLFLPRNSGVQMETPTDSSTFLLGNVNLYFEFNPFKNWRSLIEVRLTNYPDGNDVAGTPFEPYQRTDTTVADVNNGDGLDFIKHGAILLERAAIDWTGHDKLNVRVGYWLTPAGIWNVDHGTPTLIPINFSEIITSELYPRKQLGVQLYGQLLQSPAWTLGYNAYVSNGRTPGQVDLTEDKMVGGRLTATTRKPGLITVGMSGYIGRYADEVRTTTSFEPLTIERTETVAYHEWALGADLSMDLGRWKVRMEGVVRQQTYVEGKRMPAAAPGTFLRDRTQLDLVSLLSYTTDGGWEPWVLVETFKAEEEFARFIIAPSIGLNYHFNPTTTLKLQYHRDLVGDRLGDILAPKAIFGNQIGFHDLGVRLVMAL